LKKLKGQPKGKKGEKTKKEKGKTPFAEGVELGIETVKQTHYEVGRHAARNSRIAHDVAEEDGHARVLLRLHLFWYIYIIGVYLHSTCMHDMVCMDI